MSKRVPLLFGHDTGKRKPKKEKSAMSFKKAKVEDSDSDLEVPKKPTTKIGKSVSQISLLVSPQRSPIDSQYSPSIIDPRSKSWSNWYQKSSKKGIFSPQSQWMEAANIASLNTPEGDRDSYTRDFSISDGNSLKEVEAGLKIQYDGPEGLSSPTLLWSAISRSPLSDSHEKSDSPLESLSQTFESSLILQKTEYPDPVIIPRVIYKPPVENALTAFLSPRTPNEDE